MTKCSRLEQEINLLRHELAMMRCDRDELYQKHANHLQYCTGGANCKKIHSTQMTGHSTPSQELYIAYLEDQIRRTRLKYQQQMGDVKSSACLLETKLQKVRQDMSCITARARQVDKLQKNVQVLKSKLQRRDLVIARYNAREPAFIEHKNNFEQQSTQDKYSQNQIENLRKTDEIEADGCDGDKNEFEILSDMKSESSIDFFCLSVALKNKMMND